MSGNSDNCIFLIACLGTLETTFGGQKNFPFGRGILSWSETPYFPKGGPLRMVPKLPLSAEMKGFFLFKQL